MLLSRLKLANSRLMLNRCWLAMYIVWLILKAYIVLKHEQIVDDIQYGRWRKSQVPLAQTNSEVFWN